MKKLHLDANVVLRFLIGEPKEMAESSRSLMEKADSGAVSLQLSLIVLAEVYWVLHSYYEFSRSRISEVLGQFIQSQNIQTEEESLALKALNLAADKDVDFIDAFLSSKASSLNQAVVTFDESDFETLDVDWKIPDDV